MCWIKNLTLKTKSLRTIQRFLIFNKRLISINPDRSLRNSWKNRIRKPQKFVNPGNYFQSNK